MQRMSAPIAQLHRALVDALLHSRHHKPNQPVTVAEIYQDLIPYRVVRTTVGFALNADYEHALLQLLAGEGNYARVEPAEVQQELQRELRTSNPNVSVFRNFAACDVFVALPADFEQRKQSRKPQEAAERVPTTQAAPGAQPAPGNGRQNEQAAQVKQAPAQTAAPVSAAAGAPVEPAGSAPARATAACSACKKPLPRSRIARFCPYCGHDQVRRQCASCQEPLEPAWKFCVACGTPTT